MFLEYSDLQLTGSDDVMPVIQVAETPKDQCGDLRYLTFMSDKHVFFTFFLFQFDDNASNNIFLCFDLKSVVTKINMSFCS